MELPWLYKEPVIPESVYVEPSARIVGDVELGEACSVWYHAVIRGDVFPIRVGARTNVQDGAILHCTRGKAATTLGDDVSIGHRAILHGCTVGSRVLIGMGAVVMDGAVIGDDCIIGAGALVTPGVVIPAGSLAVGSPARVRRPLTEAERAFLVQSAQNYMGYAEAYRQAWAAGAPGLARLPGPPEGASGG